MKGQLDVGELIRFELRECECMRSECEQVQVRVIQFEVKHNSCEEARVRANLDGISERFCTVR